MGTASGTDAAARLDLLRTAWLAVAPVGSWEDDFGRLTDEWRAVEWRSGGKTLLAAMGLQFNEVYLCRGLAWLLDPDGGHGMGRDPLEALLHSLGLDVVDGAPVEIRVEEGRADTRADLVLRVGEQTVIFEAKVNAGEQSQQGDRLAEHWKRWQPTLVFLTRTGYAPTTARKSEDEWVTRTWRDIAQLVRAVAEQKKLEPSAGAREFIETIGAL